MTHAQRFSSLPDPLLSLMQLHTPEKLSFFREICVCVSAQGGRERLYHTTAEPDTELLCSTYVIYLCYLNEFLKLHT